MHLKVLKVGNFIAQALRNKKAAMSF